MSLAVATRADPPPTDLVRGRLAIVIGDLLRDAPTGARYRILSTAPVEALAGLLAACRAELPRVARDVCEWCASSAHPVTECPELPLDLALALYES